MNEEHWRATLLSNMAFAKSAIIEFGEIPGLFSIHRKDGSKLALSFPFVHEGQKQAGLKLIQMAAIAHDAEALMSLVESWALVIENEDPDLTVADVAKQYHGVKAADSPDRVEVIYGTMAYYDDAGDRKIVSGMGYIKRDAAGKVLDLADIEVSREGDVALGNIPAILFPKRPASSLCAHALRLWEQQGRVMMGLVGMKERTIP